MRFIGGLFLALGVSCASADTIYKCTGPDGKLVFSDKKCQENAERIEYQHPETWREKLDRENRESEIAREKERAAREAERAEWDAKIAEQRARHNQMCMARIGQTGLKIGMPRDELIKSQIWGYPDDINTTTTANGVREYFVYRCEGYDSIRMYLVNGRLESIHN